MSTRRAFWLLNVVYDVQRWGFSTYPWTGARVRAGKRCNINPAPPGVSMVTCPHCLLVLLVSDSCVELHRLLLVTWAGLVLTLTFSNISHRHMCFSDPPKRKILPSFTQPYRVFQPIWLCFSNGIQKKQSLKNKSSVLIFTDLVSGKWIKPLILFAFQCQHCEKAFMNASFLQSHLRRRHPTEFDISEFKCAESLHNVSFVLCISLAIKECLWK